MLRNWSQTSGVITDEIDGDETSAAEIQYEFKGEQIRFVSRYGGSSVKIGQKVFVLFDPETGDAEELKWSNRWLPSIAMFIFGTVFCSVALFVD